MPVQVCRAQEDYQHLLPLALFPDRKLSYLYSLTRSNTVICSSETSLNFHLFQVHLQSKTMLYHNLIASCGSSQAHREFLECHSLHLTTRLSGNPSLHLCKIWILDEKFLCSSNPQAILVKEL